MWLARVNAIEATVARRFAHLQSGPDVQDAQDDTSYRGKHRVGSPQVAKPSMQSSKREAFMADEYGIEERLAEAQAMLEALKKGNLHIGAPGEGRTEAKMFDLRRQIADYRKILKGAMPRGVKDNTP